MDTIFIQNNITRERDVIVFTVKKKFVRVIRVFLILVIYATELEWSLADGRQRCNWATAAAGGRNKNKPLLTRVWVGTSGKLTYRFRFETH